MRDTAGLGGQSPPGRQIPRGRASSERRCACGRGTRRRRYSRPPGLPLGQQPLLRGSCPTGGSPNRRVQTPWAPSWKIGSRTGPLPWAARQRQPLPAGQASGPRCRPRPRHLRPASAHENQQKSQGRLKTRDERVKEPLHPSHRVAVRVAVRPSELLLELLRRQVVVLHPPIVPPTELRRIAKSANSCL